MEFDTYCFMRGCFCTIQYEYPEVSKEEQEHQYDQLDSFRNNSYWRWLWGTHPVPQRWVYQSNCCLETSWSRSIGGLYTFGNDSDCHPDLTLQSGYILRHGVLRTSPTLGITLFLYPEEEDQFYTSVDNLSDVYQYTDISSFGYYFIFVSQGRRSVICVCWWMNRRLSRYELYLQDNYCMPLPSIVYLQVLYCTRAIADLRCPDIGGLYTFENDPDIHPDSPMIGFYSNSWGATDISNFGY